MPRYYIVVRTARTTRCCAPCAAATLGLILGSGACPEARQTAQTTAEQRREAIARMWRDSKPAPAPLLATEAAWMLTLQTVPSAGGAMDDDHIYIPLRDASLVALDRETGVIAWTQQIDTMLPPTVGAGMVFVLANGALQAFDTSDGSVRWSVPFDGAVSAPPVSEGGWLVLTTEPGDVVAFRASDGHLIWRQHVGAPSSHRAALGDDIVCVSLNDNRLVALALESGQIVWEQKLAGTISEPAIAKDRVFVGSSDNFFYAFDQDKGTLEWKWRNGGDVIGAASDGDVVYFASLDNMIRAVNRGNGNQRWTKPTGTRPLFPPVAFGGIVVLPGLMPAITVFAGEKGAVLGSQAAAGNLVATPLIDRRLKPLHVALVLITREGVVEALRPAALMFRETALVPVQPLPGRPLLRERFDLERSSTAE